MLLNKKRIRNSDPPWVYEHFKTGYQRAQLFEENPSSGTSHPRTGLDLKKKETL